MTSRAVSRCVLGLLIVTSTAVIVKFKPTQSYERAKFVAAYEIRDMGAAPGAAYRVIYLGALRGHHTVYHGGAISNGVVGTSINLANRTDEYDPQPCLVDTRHDPASVVVLNEGTSGHGGIVFSINSSGQATGTFANHTLFFDGRTARSLLPLEGRTNCEGRCISSTGDISGFSFSRGKDSYLHETATLWSRSGVPQDLGIPSGCVSSRANAINDQGQIAVAAITKKVRTRSFIYERGHFTDLGSLGGVATVAEAINSAGQIVGTSEVRRGIFHAFLWEKGHMRDLGVLAKIHTYCKATGVNNRGEVCGWSGVGEGWNSITRPFVWDANGGMRDLTKEVGYGSLFQPRTAYGISDEGEVLVYGYRKRFWHTVQGLSVLKPFHNGSQEKTR